MQTHISLPIKGLANGGFESKAYWAAEPGAAGKAIVFVHGFKGEALSTWKAFNDILPARAECRDHDLIFYGHDGGRFHVEESAQYLYSFLGDLGASPRKVFDKSFTPSMQRPANFAYEKIVLVAHSLGAVLCRLALLTAYRKRDDWAQRTRLVLFAPAHNGTDVANLLSSVITAFDTPIIKLGAVVESLYKARYKGASDIETDSPVLEELKQKTEQALGTGKADYLKAVKVIWSLNDSVVVNKPFAEDADPENVPLSHTKVCKPNTGYLDPVEFLIQSI